MELARWPQFTVEERKAVELVLESGHVNQWTGTEVNTFGAEFAAYHGVAHGIPNANGTLALELPLRALGSTGDVVVPSATFIATASACVAVGTRPIMADVDLDTHGLSAATLESASTSSTSAAIPVHFGGHPVEIEAIRDLCTDRGWALIEDCAQAHGAEVNGRKVGTFGDAGSFSFCQDKIMTTGGEGGMVITDNEELFKRMWSYKDHGKDYDLCFNTEHPPGFRWLHTSFGTNWRMTEMQAAIGRIQLQKLPAWIEARTRNAGILATCVEDLDAIRLPIVRAGVKHAYYKFYCYVRPERLAAGWDRDRIMLELNKQGIPVTIGSSSEIYLEEAFKRAGWGLEKRLPNAKVLGETSLCFQVHPTLEPEHMHAIGEALRAVVRSASK